MKSEKVAVDGTGDQGLGKWLAMMLCCAWAIWVVVDYLAHHSYLTKAIVQNPYGKTMLAFFLPSLGIAYWLYQKIQSSKQSTVSFRIRGIALFGLLQLTACIILLSFANTAYLPDVAAPVRLGCFLFYSTLYTLGFLLILTAAFALGDPLLSRHRKQYPKAYSLIAIALGMGMWGIALTLLGLAGLLQPMVLWALIAALFIWRYKSILPFWVSIAWEVRTVKIQKWWTPLLYVLLFVVLSINFIGGFKTFPIGYDGSGLYLNKAELIAQSGRLPAGGQAFNWSVVMSFGHILFGSRTMAILLSHWMGFLCFFACFRLARTWLKPSYALLAAIIPLISPYLSYHNLVDEKVDLGFTFIVLCSLLLVWKPIAKGWFFSGEKTDVLQAVGKSWTLPSGLYPLMLAAGLAGFAFGIKYTALFYFLALISLLFYLAGQRNAFAGSILFFSGLLFVGGIHRFGYVEMENGTAIGLGALFCTLGAGLLVWRFRKDRSPIRSLSLQLLGMGVAFVLPFLPWAGKHLSEHKSIGIQQLIEGIEAKPDIKLKRWQRQQRKKNSIGQIQETTQPKALFTKEKADKSRKKKKADRQAIREEIKRYIGFEAPFWMFASLPYDASMNVNIPEMRYLDIGCLFLLLFPIWLLLSPGRKRPIWLSALVVLVLLLYLALSLYSVYAPDGAPLDVNAVMEQQSKLFQKHPGGSDSFFFSLYAACLQGLLGISALLGPVYKAATTLGNGPSIFLLFASLAGCYPLMRGRLQEMPILLKSFVGFLLVYGLLWWILGNAIIWYAMPFFVLLPIPLVHLLQKPDSLMGSQSKTFSKIFLSSIFGLYLIFGGLLSFTSAFPNDASSEPIFRWPFVDFVSNPDADKDNILRYFNPVIPDALTYMNANDEEKIYRVNTHFGFHIRGNDRRVYSDPVLQKFDQITKELEDKSQFFDILKSNGFRYILLDLRTAQADQSPEQSLRDKFIKLADLLLQSNKVQLLVTDNYVADPNAAAIRLPNGQQAQARPALVGQTIYLGYLALFEIR